MRYYHFVFFFFIRPRLESTLFPYTTLFRSRPARAPRPRLPPAAPRRSRSCPPPPAALPSPPAGDRKSTRLNSSHLGISYAVFCLKKKIAKVGVEISDSPYVVANMHIMTRVE